MACSDMTITDRSPAGYSFAFDCNITSVCRKGVEIGSYLMFNMGFVCKKVDATELVYVFITTLLISIVRRNFRKLFSSDSQYIFP